MAVQAWVQKILSLLVSLLESKPHTKIPLHQIIKTEKLKHYHGNGSPTRINAIAVVWFGNFHIKMSMSSRKRLRTKVTPDLHLTYSKTGGNQGLIINGKRL